MIFKYCIYLLLLVLFYGCETSAPIYVVEIDSITDPAYTPKMKYYLYPADSSISVNDLYYKEYSSYVKNILNKNKYVQTSIDSADILILMRYGIGNLKQQSYSYSLPVFGRTDAGDATITSSSTTYGNIGSTNVRGTTNSTTTVKSKPTYGVVASNTYSGTYTTYFRFLILEAIDWHSYMSNASINTIWKTTVTSEGSSDDLRLVMPAMIVGSANYIGKNTGNKLEIDIKTNDPRILLLKQK